MIEISKRSDYIKYSFDNDKDNKRLKLLIILSPIFIASFDNGDYELEFLNNTIENSKFPYGLYPHFFDGFDKDHYRDSYKNYDLAEDIFLTLDEKIEFYVNPMDDEYVLALKTLLEKLILDDNNLNELLIYFELIRDDIVRNGRRSILANGIQGFYLQKYVVVWMIELCNKITDQNPSLNSQLNPIFELANNLKTPRQK